MNGSYFETGMEFSVQNGNLSSLTLKPNLGITPATTYTCNVSAKITLQSCFSNAKFGNR